MNVVTKAPAGASAAELMDQLNTETAKLNAWIRTQANSPAQRPWFADAGGADRNGQPRQGARRRQPDEDAAASLALARDQSVSLQDRRDRRAAPK